METKELTCIRCPLGCLMSVTMEGKEVQQVEGNTCPRGDAYARVELVNPTRMVTTTMRIAGGYRRRVPVKTASDIPKDKIFDVMREIDAATVKAPAKIGEVLLKDVAGTGVDVIATKTVEGI